MTKLLLRATLALLCLAGLSLAAPAPLPQRPKRGEESYPWGGAGGGLRMRLVPADRRARVGEPVRLYLEVQNVSGRQLIADVPVLPSYVDREQDDPPSGWGVRAARVGSERERVMVTRRVQMKLVRELYRFAPGQTLRCAITLSSDHGERRADERVREDEDRKAQMYFRGAAAPGTYEFRVTFRRPPINRRQQEGVWDGDGLDSPPVRVEVVR
jgi:hypothetical protein